MGKIQRQSHFRSRFKNIHDLVEDAFSFLRIFAADGSGDTGVEVLLEDDGSDSVESGLDSLDLADDVDAVFVFLEHSLYAADVTLGGLQAADSVIVIHYSLLA